MRCKDLIPFFFTRLLLTNQWQVAVRPELKHLSKISSLWLFATLLSSRAIFKESSRPEPADPSWRVFLGTPKATGNPPVWIVHMGLMEAEANDPCHLKACAMPRAKLSDPSPCPAGIHRTCDLILHTSWEQLKTSVEAFETARPSYFKGLGTPSRSSSRGVRKSWYQLFSVLSILVGEPSPKKVGTRAPSRGT